MLRLSTELHDLDDVQVIDATGVDRVAASQHYAKRTNYTFEAVKTTAVIDCSTGTILYIHWSTRKPHDTQFGWQLLLRNVENLDTVVADKGYDWCLLRRRFLSEGVEPLIVHCEHGWNGYAQNALIDDGTSHRRSLAETTFFAIRRKYGGTLQARTWFGQFRELVLKCGVRTR